MKIALTGASGLVGRFLLAGLRAAGHQVVTLGRRGADITFDLAGPPPDLSGADALVHAGLAHLPGKYRGGEGDDPERFTRLNRDGSLRLMTAAARAGVPRLAFLSTRAVYGAYPPGTALTEDLTPKPDTLYGAVKLSVEQELPALAPHTISLRATGVYGAGPDHKWSGLFRDYLRGAPVTPRVATEVHGHDLCTALVCALDAPGHHLLNVSDLLLDRHDLLAEVARLTDCPHPLPRRADAAQVSAMTCDRLRALGWRPGGTALLHRSLPAMLPGAV